LEQQMYRLRRRVFQVCCVLWWQLCDMYELWAGQALREIE
jgi:hypothetical protein